MTDQPRDNLPAPTAGSIRDLLRMEQVKERFREVLADKAPLFVASLANLIYTSPALKECEPYSVIGAALVAASLDLPVDKNIGFAYIVPYRDNQKRQTLAQFQMGYKGYVQLALRSNQYRTIHVTEIYAGEVRGVDRFTGELITGEKTGDEIIGYLAYFELLSGFRKTLYMTVAEIKAHGAKYSKNYGSDKSIWQTNFDAMARKTVLRKILTKWGVLSVEMRRAFQAEVVPEDEPTNGGNGKAKPEHASALWGEPDEESEAPLNEDGPPPAEAPVTEVSPESAESKPALLKIKDAVAWQKLCKELVAAHPKYSLHTKGKPSGVAEMHHILNAAGKCGFVEVTDANAPAVIEAIAKRAALEMAVTGS